MKIIIASILAIVAVLAISPLATQSNSPRCDHVTAERIAKYSKSVWHPSKWRRGVPSPQIRKAYRKGLACAENRAHKRVGRRAWVKNRRSFLLFRQDLLESRKQAREQRREERQRQAEVDALTPYDCGNGFRSAIPCYIAACESGFSWDAYNPSGAAGPYQIMPFWNRPWPVVTEEDKLEHHRIAADIWNGGAGASNWVCA